MGTPIEIDATAIQLRTASGDTKSQNPKSWFKTNARWYQNEVDQRRDITSHQACFWALASTAEEALTAIKASNAFQENLLGPLSEPLPAISHELPAPQPILVSQTLFNDLQGSIFEGSAVVFFIEAL